MIEVGRCRPMSYQFPPDVEKLAKNLMATGNYQSEDDLLRDALTTLQESHHLVSEEDPLVVEGIRRGLDEMKRGLGRPFEEFDQEFRTKHNIPRDE
jgi:Arc/MetJ-type ribon-helix-helix transcriptional regulator